MARGRPSASYGRRIRRPVLLGLLTLAALTAGAPAHATFVGQNGKIAYLNVTSSSCLQMVNPDGTGHVEPGACDITFTARLSPGGDRVVTPVYNAVNDVFDQGNSKLDGTDRILIPGSHYEIPVHSWSHDGRWIASVYEFTCASCPGAYFETSLADGSGTMGRGGYASMRRPVVWSTNGWIASAWNWPDGPLSNIETFEADGPSYRTVFSEPGLSGDPDWSPGGGRIVFSRSPGLSGGNVAVVNADGTGLQNLTTTSSDGAARWSPDGQTILFISGRDGNWEIYSMHPDGTAQTRLTNNAATEQNAIWSPDSQKIAFESDRDGDRDVYVMNRDGTGLVNVTANSTADNLQDWQTIPINAYPRPKGATPLYASLVPAYTRCTGSPTRQHGPPLSFASCNPPVQTSDELTVGSADSNGKPTRSVSTIKLKTIPGVPPNPPDEADVKLEASITDVYNQGALTDYTGELRAQTSLRITDKLNTPHPGGPGAGTVADFSFGFTIPCAPSPDPNEGGTCTLNTTADALYPGAIAEGRRAIWQLGQVEVYDGGADDDGDTPADNTLFMKQGIFIP